MHTTIPSPDPVRVTDHDPPEQGLKREALPGLKGVGDESPTTIHQNKD